MVMGRKTGKSNNKSRKTATTGAGKLGETAMEVRELEKIATGVGKPAFSLLPTFSLLPAFCYCHLL